MAENDRPLVWPQEEFPNWNDSSKTDIYDRPLSYCHTTLLYEEENPDKYDTVGQGWTILGKGRVPRRPKGKKERTKIRIIRNDHLGISEHPLEWEAPWFQRLKEWDIRVLILNTGAHLVEDYQFVETLKTVMKALEEMHPDIVVIFRDTPQGTGGGRD